MQYDFIDKFAAPKVCTGVLSHTLIYNTKHRQISETWSLLRKSFYFTLRAVSYSSSDGVAVFFHILDMWIADWKQNWWMSFLLIPYTAD